MDLRIGDYGLHVIASHAEVKPFSVSGVNCSDAPYLRFCLTHQDPGIKDLIEEARVLSKAKINVKLREKAGILRFLMMFTVRYIVTIKVFRYANMSQA